VLRAKRARVKPARSSFGWRMFVSGARAAEGFAAAAAA